MTEPTHDELLAREYLQLMQVVDQFDARALIIKAWSVTFSAAGLGTAYFQRQPVLLLIAAGSALVFWMIDALWKTSQRAHYPRIEEIEAHFKDPETSGTKPFCVRASRRRAFSDWSKGFEALKVMYFSQVALPHVVIFLMGMILYFWAPPT